MKVAVLFGANGSGQFPRLKFAEQDAAALAKKLAQSRFGFAPKVIKSSKTPDGVVKELRDACVDLEPSDVFLCYLSCHGVLMDGDLYLVVNGSRPNQKRTFIPAAQVVSAFDECKADNKLLILDCCNAGAAAKGDDGQPLPVENIPGLKNQVTLFASDVFESARESLVLRASFLRWGLCTALDAAPPGDASLATVLKSVAQLRTQHVAKHPGDLVPRPFLVGRVASDFHFEAPTPDPSPIPPTKQRRLRRPLVLLASVFILAAAIGAWFALRGPRRARTPPERFIVDLLRDKRCSACVPILVREQAFAFTNSMETGFLDLKWLEIATALEAQRSRDERGRLFLAIASPKRGPDVRVWAQFAQAGAPQTMSAINTPWNIVTLPWLESEEDSATVMQSGMSIPEMQFAQSGYLRSISDDVAAWSCRNWPLHRQDNGEPIPQMDKIVLARPGCTPIPFLARSDIPPNIAELDRVRFSMGLPPLGNALSRQPSAPNDALRINVGVNATAGANLHLVVALVWVPSDVLTNESPDAPLSPEPDAAYLSMDGPETIDASATPTRRPSPPPPTTTIAVSCPVGSTAKLDDVDVAPNGTIATRAGMHSASCTYPSGITSTVSRDALRGKHTVLEPPRRVPDRRCASSCSGRDLIGVCVDSFTSRVLYDAGRVSVSFSSADVTQDRELRLDRGERLQVFEGRMRHASIVDFAVRDFTFTAHYGGFGCSDNGFCQMTSCSPSTFGASGLVAGDVVTIRWGP